MVGEPCEQRRGAGQAGEALGSGWERGFPYPKHVVDLGCPGEPDPPTGSWARGSETGDASFGADTKAQDLPGCEGTGSSAPALGAEESLAAAPAPPPSTAAPAPQLLSAT